MREKHKSMSMEMNDYPAHLIRRGHHVMDMRRKELQPEYYTETAGLEVYIMIIIQTHKYRSYNRSSNGLPKILRPRRFYLFYGQM